MNTQEMGGKMVEGKVVRVWQHKNGQFSQFSIVTMSNYSSSFLPPVLFRTNFSISKRRNKKALQNGQKGWEIRLLFFRRKKLEMTKRRMIHKPQARLRVVNLSPILT